MIDPTPAAAESKPTSHPVLRRLWRFGRNSVERYSSSQAPRLAAAMSYYAVFSIFPLLLILGALAEHALGDSAALRSEVLKWASGSSSIGVRRAIEEVLDNVAERAPSPATGIGIGLLGAIFGASGVFVHFDGALARIFRVQQTTQGFRAELLRILRDRLLAFVVVLGTSLALLVTTVARGALELPRSFPGAHLFAAVASLLIGGGALTLGIALCYRLMPDRHVPWSSACIGAVDATIALHAVREPFAWIVVRLTSYAAYGVIGAVLGLLTWLQAAGCILFFGACVAATHAEQ